MIAALSTLATWVFGLFNAGSSGLVSRIARYALFSVYIAMVWMAINKIMSFAPSVDLGLPPCAAHMWNIFQLSQAISGALTVLVVGFVTKQGLAYWRDM